MPSVSHLLLASFFFFFVLAVNKHFSLLFGLDKQIMFPIKNNSKYWISNLNKGRRNVAKTDHIGNMNELEWDDTLEMHALLTCREGAIRKDVPGRHVLFLKDKQFQKELAKNWLKLIRKQDLWPGPFIRMEIAFHPLQSKIGCVARRCRVTTGAYPQGLDLEGICVMGPYRTLKPSHLRNGPLGSQCGLLPVRDGLCVPRPWNPDPIRIFPSG